MVKLYLCYTQVGYFQGTIRREQKITRFYVFVNDALTVQVLEALNQLAKVPINTII